MRLHSGDKSLLCSALFFQCSKNVFVDRSLAHEVMDCHHRFLALPPESCVGLFLELQRPAEGTPDQDMSAALDVQAVTGRCRMDQRNWNPAIVPVLNILRFPDIPWAVPARGQMLHNTLPVVLEPICDEYRLSDCGFD